MPVHYPTPILEEARELGFQVGTLAVGKDAVWQGPIDTEASIAILQMIQFAREGERARRKVQAEQLLAEVTMTIPGMEDVPPPAKAAPAPVPNIVHTAPRFAEPPPAKRGRGRPKKK